MKIENFGINGYKKTVRKCHPPFVEYMVSAEVDVFFSIQDTG